MAIVDGDVKLYQSLAMNQTDNGGGRMSNNVIPDGGSNSVFDDISELQRAYGGVDLSKVFVAVQTLNVDKYFGAMMTLDTKFLDSKVHGILFSTGDHADLRKSIQDHVERYVVSGPLSRYFVWDTQIEGQRAVLLYASVGEIAPEIGEVYLLIELPGDPAEISQYVRINNVERETRTFTDSQGNYSRDVFTCEISAPLVHTFTGTAMRRNDEWPDNDARFHETLIADAAKYYGVSNLTAPGAINDGSITVDSVYGQLVPATRGETPIVDVQAGAANTQVITSGGEDFSIAGPSHTQIKEITLGNRAYTYVFNLQPIPAVGVTTVDYRALGRWYRLSDQGDGTLAGTGGGSGSINYQTGTLTVTLGALPDVGSVVVPTWGSTVHYQDRAGQAEIDAPRMYTTLQHAIDPAGTNTISWLDSGSVARTATIASNGTISGDATGTAIHATGELRIDFDTAKLPASSNTITFDYRRLEKRLESIQGQTSGQVVTVNLAYAPIKPGSVNLYVPYLSQNGGQYWTGTRTQRTLQTIVSGLEPYIQHLTDDGAGGFVEDDTAVINYTTGEITFSFYRDEDRNQYENHVWLKAVRTAKYNGTITAIYSENSVTPLDIQEIFPSAPLHIQLIPTHDDTIVPGTLRFTVGGQNFSDRAGQGTLYHDDGTVAGVVDYNMRVAELQVYSLSGGTVSITSMVTVYGQWTDYEFTYRTPGSPLQPGSLIQNATTEDGTLLSETTDQNGVISSATAEGTVEQDMGFVQIKFGSLELDSSLTAEQKAEWWYDPADIENGYIWVPKFVFPNTVLASMVVYTFLPLESDVLGLDPVRLPSDGRVPIMRPGYLVIIHHEDSIVENTPTNGEQIDCGRQRLTRVRIVDDNGTKLVQDTDFSVDLDTGIVTLGDPAGFTAPFTIYHRVEDVRMCSDVRIDGVITLTQPLSHVFPQNQTLVSSVLIVNTLFAQLHTEFEQETWTSVWSDSLIGNAPTASYNETQYPIAVTNTGAIKERWVLIFDNTTTGRVVGETVGQIAVFDTAVDLAPVNPITGQPYFTLLAAGWGAGWAAGNCLRFNTEAAAYPVDVARCIEQGAAEVEDDLIYLAIRGDVDAP